MRVVTFGEVMLRLCPEENLRVRQVLPGRLEATFGGGELNVAVSIAFQGGESAFLTALPNNPITDSLVQEARKLGVDASLVRRVSDGRFGIYFVETGANQRGGAVIYDRSWSSISLTDPGERVIHSWGSSSTMSTRIADSGTIRVWLAIRMA